MAPSPRSAAQGLLLGLCAGDRNGGPQRMALRVVEAMMEAEASAGKDKEGLHPSFDRSLLVSRYLSWFKGGPAEPQAAYDTGNVFANVLAAYSRCGVTSTTDLEAIASRVPDASRSAGVNPAHRNCVLAAVSWLDESQLMEAVRLETQITHLHVQAVETAMATAAICRHLIQTATSSSPTSTPHHLRLLEAVAYARAFVSEPLLMSVLSTPFPTRPMTQEERRGLDRGGHSPLVLGAALSFLFSESSFDESLTQSMLFAGGANYCPVLVGSIGGALYGVEAVRADDEALLDHPEYRGRCDPLHEGRIETAAAWLGGLWS